MTLPLHGLRLVITGGASGVGEATAKYCAASGARVFVLDVDATRGQLLEQSVPGVTFVECDVRSDDSVRQAVDRATDAGEALLDGVFANAGVILNDTVESDSLARFDATMDLNVRGVFLTLRHCMPRLKRPGGSVVVTASGAGVVGTANSASYCTSKGAVIALTREVALDYASQGIRVNAVSPGVIDTPQGKRVFAELGDPDELRRETEQVIPLKRLGRPEEVAHVAAFLLSSLSSYMTGAIVAVDGGYTAQ